MFHTKFMLFSVVALMTIGSAIAIINGKDALRRQFPYFAYLKTFEAKSAWSWRSAHKYHTCGGSLVSNQWILTAAQCLVHSDGAEVLLGVGKLYNPNEDGREIFNVTKEDFRIHPSYKKDQPFVNDVALIKLPSEASLSEYIQSVPFVCSPATVATEVITMGFGRVSVTDKIYATTLQYTELQTVDANKCLSDVHGLASAENLVCADEKQTSICKGDIGGPLVLAESGELIGIASYAHRNCKLGHLHAFIDVSAHVQWIEEVTEDQICKK